MLYAFGLFYSKIMFTLHKNILMDFFLSKQIVGFSNKTQIVGFSNGDDSEDLFLTKTLTNMKYPPNVIKNLYPRPTLRTNLCTKTMINSFQWCYVLAAKLK